MTFDLAGRRALVTGGTRGIGKAIAARLADCGADVVATGTDPVALAELDRMPRVTSAALDLRDDSAIATFLAASVAAPFDILINNAGINRHARVGELLTADFDEIIRINVRAVMLLCRGIVPLMVERGYGRIVNITSIFAVVGKPARASYATSKTALAGFSRALALDYADKGVLVNAVAPGFIATEMTARMLGESGIREMTSQVPLGRLGTPEEVATLVAFLASADNSFITGQNIVIDGGFTSQ